MSNSALFDPGFAEHTNILSANIEYIYSGISRFKNLGQKKTQFKIYYKKIIDLVDNNIAFYLGCLLWASYIKDLGTKNILNNPCLGEVYDEDATLKEILFTEKYLEQLKKDAKYYLGIDYDLKPEYEKILSVYKDFIIMNKGFVNTKTTNDLLLPEGLKKLDNPEKVNEEIHNVIKTGELKKLLELYGTIL